CTRDCSSTSCSHTYSRFDVW
nr:immunoglobulin heavy chain junction region [Macaca mulatta]MOV49233.1 immunoglobulin heavy chain junction region [Macaca mulatta]MOV49365.1 immunoglobulin heavy chain junction region [Macaca mulatta]MOV49517.1 immunoglobulin heavy chain junction region [Macaca mulatta]MOV49701.1 immunoglobulin heavy chain junction region [Macaca mulatta]